MKTCFPKGFNASTWFNHHFFLRYTINVDQLMDFMVIDHQHWGYYSNHGLCHEKFSFHRGPLCTELDVHVSLVAHESPHKIENLGGTPCGFIFLCFFDCWCLLSFFPHLPGEGC